MHWKSQLKCAAGSVGTAIAFLGVHFPTSPALKSVKSECGEASESVSCSIWLNIDDDILLWIAIACAGLGAICALIALISLAWSWFAAPNKRFRKLERRAEPDLSLIEAGGKWITENWSLIDGFANEVLEEDRVTGFLSRERLIQHADMGQSVHVVVDKGGQTKLVGMAILLRLNQHGYSRITEGKIKTGHQIHINDVSSSLSKTAAVYIAGLYGSRDLSRAMVLALVKKEMSALLKANSNIRCVLGRAATSNGTRLLDKFGFFPLEKNSEIRILPRLPALVKASS